MTYNLDFVPAAHKEWQKLDSTIRDQFSRKLKERLQNPRVPSAKLYRIKNRYKIKLRDVGYRLIYEVHDDQLIVLVVAIGRRDKSEAYELARRR